MTQSARDVVANQYLGMRSRILTLAADLDRIQRSQDGANTLAADERLKALRACIEQLLSDEVGRAERVQMILSD